MTDFLPRPVESVVFKELDDGAVLFCTRTEVYFGVNAVGRFIWNLLPPALASFEELDGRIGEEFPDVAAADRRADAQEFLAALVELGLASPNQTAIPQGA